MSYNFASTHHQTAEKRAFFSSGEFAFRFSDPRTDPIATQSTLPSAKRRLTAFIAIHQRSGIRMWTVRTCESFRFFKPLSCLPACCFSLTLLTLLVALNFLYSFPSSNRRIGACAMGKQDNCSARRSLRRIARITLCTELNPSPSCV